jgi:hypothetical protein
MIFHDWLEVMDKEAFAYCRSLVGINIPPSVKAIKENNLEN